MTHDGSRREGTRQQKGEASEDRNQERWQQKGRRGTTGALVRSEGLPPGEGGTVTETREGN